MSLQAISFSAAFWSYIGQTIAFSIALLLIARPSNRILLWVLANLIGVFGVYLLGASHATGSPSALAAVLNLTAPLLRALALGSGNLLSRRNRVATAFAACAACGILLTIPFASTPFRGLLVVLSSTAALLASVFYLAAERRSRGMAATIQMQVVNILLVVLMGSQLFVVYPFGQAGLLFNDSQRLAFGATGLVALGTVWQIAFFNLVTARNARAALIAARRTMRLQDGTRLLNTRLRLTQDLANERLNLLRLVSHEVRQPLNNAQAALHSLIEQNSEIRSGRKDATNAATRIQGILDDVILAISNSIIAASIIEWRRNPAMLPIAVIETLDLAVMDCSPEELRRIRVSRPQGEVFPSADPALLRLALRNLLSNALKYSPPGSAVDVALLVDEKRRGVAFQVTNIVADPASLDGNLFDRGIRGAAEGTEGSGLGLFMVAETARLHHGTIACWQLTPERVTFELFLPL